MRDVIEITSKEGIDKLTGGKRLSRLEKEEMIKRLTKEMRMAAEMLEFEHAAYLRDKIAKLKKEFSHPSVH